MSITASLRRLCALLLALALVGGGLGGCRIQSVSDQIKDLYAVYLESAESPRSSPDYENFRRVFPLACWETWRDEMFGGSESDMRFFFRENLNAVKEEYADRCGWDNTFTVDKVERERITGEEYDQIRDAMKESFGVEPGQLGEVYAVTVLFTITGGLDTLTITHRQRLMVMNGRWYFCPVGSQDYFRLFS